MASPVAYRSVWAIVCLETRRPMAFTIGRAAAVTRARRWAERQRERGRLGRYLIVDGLSLELPEVT